MDTRAVCDEYADGKKPFSHADTCWFRKVFHDRREKDGCVRFVDIGKLSKTGLLAKEMLVLSPIQNTGSLVFVDDG